MLCQITVEVGYLMVELFQRRTPEETRSALEAIAAEARTHGLAQVLISVHDSRPIFKVERSGLLDSFRKFGEASRFRIALMADSEELRLSHQYVEAVAQLAGLNVRSFQNRRAALDWFRDQRWLPDRRQRFHPFEATERRVRRRRRDPEGVRPVS